MGRKMHLWWQLVQIVGNGKFLFVYKLYPVGHGGALVETAPFDRRVVCSNPALAAMKGPWASLSLTVACSASVCKLQHSVNCCGRERFRKAHAVRSAIEMEKYNTIQYPVLAITIRCWSIIEH